MKLIKKQSIPLLIIAWLVGVSGMMLSSCSPVNRANNDIALLKEHYSTYPIIDKYALGYEQFSPNTYQSYDYLNPDTLHNSIKIEMDLEKNQFYASRIFRYPGILHFDYIEYHNGSEGYWYDGGNGTAMGNWLFEKDKESIKGVAGEAQSLVDLLTVQKLFNKQSIDTFYQVKSNYKNKIIIEEILVSNDTLVYMFSKKPVSLLSVYHKKDKRLFGYSAHRTVGDLQVAGKVEISIDGKHKHLCHIKSFNIIEKIDKQKLIPPKERHVLKRDFEAPLKAVAISKETYVIHNSAVRRNVIVHLSDNDIIILGAPGYNKMSEKVIELVEHKFPDKKIKYVYVSHFHIDHTLGLTAYAKKGISILSDKYSIEAIIANPVFASDSMTFLPIVHKQTMMGITFYLLENSHSKGQTFAYIPEVKTIYEGDFLEMPIDKSIPSHMPKSTKTFLDYIEQKKIDVERVVGHHTSDNISQEMIQAYLLNTNIASYKGQ